MKRDVLLPAVVILLSIVPLQLRGADQASAKPLPPDVLFAVYPAQSAAQAFVPVVLQAVKYKLADRGLAALSADDAKDPSQLTAQARKAGTPIVLSCGISASDTRLLAISLEWRDLQKPSTPVHQDRSGPMDLTLDSVILETLDSLMTTVSKRVDELVAARTAAAATAGPATPAAGTGTAAPPTGGPGAAPALPPAGPATGTPAAPAVTPPAVAERPFFTLDASVAPFVPVGAASLYFPIGVLPSIEARFVLPVAGGRIGLGAYVGAAYFMAVGTIDSAQDFLIPFGGDVRYEIGNGAPLLLFVHLAGGPAILVIATATQGTLTDFTAFFTSGIGGTFMFSPRFGLSFAVDYEIYFEMPYLIMGFAPWVAASFKL